ncbi:METTL5 family protein [Halobellus litoreus]|uniref:METTL5 family protein n=1 Tax=Halobellus litoreus TaxID=755310 RepID=A0ABD6DUV3_9EURY|nr:METTL5 family protein [Halobellus litoreus]
MGTKSALETQLAVVAGFEDPQADLEQYPTPPELAAHVVHVADLNGDVADRLVVDLGTGTGMLALGAALRGPARVVGLDVDRAALSTAAENRRRVGTRTPIDWIHADATRAPICPDGPTTVLMNPPFGAQHGNEHADRAFLETAASISEVSYSVHNAGSREFVESFAADHGGEVTHAFQAALSLERQFDFHEADTEEIEAEVYRIEWAGSAGEADGLADDSPGA